MLSTHARGRHLSFHTPGHKQGGWDITELAYSDNLSCPRGCIAEAEKDIADILGAEKSFILTDGSTSGVLSMLYAAKLSGVKTVALCEGSHKSVFNGCAALGLTPLLYPQEKQWGTPKNPTMYALKRDFSEIFDGADALFFTSPNYYGQTTDLKALRKYCDETGKLLLIDGAHGGHLHFDKTVYAGAYADMWVDGVHKSLPAFTQGAVVSARTEKIAEWLCKGVDTFRTTSPSYPVMASVEYAVKYPQNTGLENAVREWAKGEPRILLAEDWTKVCVVFGDEAFEAEKALEKRGVYPEFCDGNIVMFYLSPATTKRQFASLKRILKDLFECFPLIETAKNETQRIPAPIFLAKNTKKEWVMAEKCVGRICAGVCGLFPPCTPLFSVGERITQEKLMLLKKANNVYGLKDGKILVVKDDENE